MNLVSLTGTAGGTRLPQPYKHHKDNDDDTVTPKTNIETSLSNQQQLENALLDPQVEPADAQRDATHNPKQNASTFHPPEPKLANNHANSRNSGVQNHNLQQIGGAYGQSRH